MSLFFGSSVGKAILRHLPVEVVEATEDGFPRIDSQLVLIDADRPPEEFEHTFPRFWAYLQEGIQRGIHESNLASRRSPWYSQERRPRAPFLCTYMGWPGAKRKPFRFHWNQSQPTARNVYLLLYPIGPLARALNQRPELYAEVFAALKQIDTDRFIGEGREYGDGLYALHLTVTTLNAVSLLRVRLRLTGSPPEPQGRP